MTSQILLVGAGGHCRSCIDVIESTGQYSIRGVVGVASEVGAVVLGYPILGCDKDLPGLIDQFSSAIVSVGQIKSPVLRMKLFELLNSAGAHLPEVVSSTATVSRHSNIQSGTIVMHGAIVNAGANVGCNSIVNSSSLVEHDCRIGDHCHISTGAILNGSVHVGDCSFIGSGAIIHQGVSIGRDVIVGAGVIVRKDIPDGSVMTGQGEGR